MIKDIEGFQMELNPSDGGISHTLDKKGLREPCFMWLLRRQSGALAVDIGANIGYTTLSMCKNFDRVMAFEPDRRSRSLLIKNLELNKYRKKCVVSSCAVSDCVGEVRFHLDSRPNLSCLGDGDYISSTTIDAACTIGQDYFFKMDIEGGEVLALRGGNKTLMAGNCKILMEVHPTKYDGDDFRVELDRLSDIGYRITRVVSAGVECPDKFRENGYEPYKTFGSRRAIYKLKHEHAVDWCSREIPQRQPNGKISPKIIRAILLEKKLPK
jgi:FkbM family methyltransferase